MSYKKYIVVAVVVILSFIMTSAHAINICVDDVDDDLTVTMANCAQTCDGTDDCTLREAMTAANSVPGFDRIIFDPNLNSQTITLIYDHPASMMPLITESVWIDGPGATQLTIDANGNGTTFDIDGGGSGVSVIIDGLTITGGVEDTAGGAIRVRRNEDNLVVNACVISGNRVTGGGGGGGIYFYGQDLYILNSTLYDNHVEGNFGGGGVSITSVTSGSTQKIVIKNSTFSQNTVGENGGGLYVNRSQSCSIINSTISGNSAGNAGGGISARATTVNLYNVTVVGNSVQGGEGGGLAGPIVLQNSIVAGNTDAGGESPNCENSQTSNGYNIIDDLTGCILAGDLATVIVQDPGLGSLAYNGGLSYTHAPSRGSPAIDAGNPGGCKDQDNANLILDQRGKTRPTDGDGDGTSRCDIGAVEVGACGDGVVGTNEECDDGANNSDVLANACRTTCMMAHCGDGVVDDGEQCDNGASNSDITPNACRTTCVNFACGDGVLDSGEGCDDGNNADGDACKSNCALPTCGNGTVEAGEVCDEGGSNSDTTPDACRTTCVNASCGDAVVDTGEACDDGDADNTDTCLNSCSAAICGDGLVAAGAEECDDRNTSDGDGCNSSCQEEAGCGDGSLDSGEECDDGNMSGGDGCSSSCSIEEHNDLATSNPNVDFDNLITGEAVNIVSPGTFLASLNVVKQLDAQSCSCDWSVNPDAKGSYDDITSCTASFTPSDIGTGQISLIEDCGAGSTNYFQTIVVNPAGTTTSSGSSGGTGCSFSKSSRTTMNFVTILFLPLVLLLGLSCLRRKKRI